jgi:hypothetical protein
VDVPNFKERAFEQKRIFRREEALWLKEQHRKSVVQVELKTKAAKSFPVGAGYTAYFGWQWWWEFCV